MSNLKEHGYDFNKIPYVLQLNKRDLPNALPVDALSKELRKKNEPVIEAVAFQGVGVFETLKEIARQVLHGVEAGRVSLPDSCILRFPESRYGDFSKSSHRPLVLRSRWSWLWFVFSAADPQPQSYHSFADQRSLLGIPNFGDVVFNFPSRWLDSWESCSCCDPIPTRLPDISSIPANAGHT